MGLSLEDARKRRQQDQGSASGVKAWFIRNKSYLLLAGGITVVVGSYVAYRKFILKPGSEKEIAGMLKLGEGSDIVF